MSIDKLLLKAFPEMSHNQIGKMLGISRAAISKYVTNRCKIPYERAVQIVIASKGRVKLREILPEIKQLEKKGYL